MYTHGAGQFLAMGKPYAPDLPVQRFAAAERRGPRTPASWTVLAVRQQLALWPGLACSPWCCAGVPAVCVCLCVCAHVCVCVHVCVCTWVCVGVNVCVRINPFFPTCSCCDCSREACRSPSSKRVAFFSWVAAATAARADCMSVFKFLCRRESGRLDVVNMCSTAQIYMDVVNIYIPIYMDV